MDQQRQRIEEDLRGVVTGEVRCDEVFLQLYASDASLYQIKPLGVVRPRSAADVAACMRYADEHRIALHARGAGTGLAGESLGPGLVLDFSCHFRRIVRTESEQVRVQPGVVHQRLNRHLRPFGKLFGPDPAMSHVTTMGSVVALDGSGSHWLRYGSARRHVRSLEVVLADGTVMEVGRERLIGGVSQDPDPRKRDLVNELADLLRRNEELIRRHQPQSLVNRSGYYLADVCTPEHLDLASLLTGSEGTLALFTELTLSIDPLPRTRAMAMLFFDRLESAARAVPEIVATDPATCDLMDRRHLSLAREKSQRYAALIPASAEAVLLVEYDGEDALEVRERTRQMVDRVRRRRRLAVDSRLAFAGEEIDLYWELARRVVPTLYRLKGSTRPVPFIEDIAIPPEHLQRFLFEMQNVLKRHEVTATLFAHAGHGQLHLRPFLDVAQPSHVRLMERLAGDLYALVFDVGGTISGEHGDGLSRTAFLSRQYGELCQVFREIKRIFDPHNILNPGKIVGDTPDLLTRNLRPAPSAGDAGQAVEASEPTVAAGGGLVQVQLRWAPGEMAEVARCCNGCGACRSQAGDVRMCPIFRIAPAEEASPRAKANLVRAMFCGQLSQDEWKSQAVKEVADLCVNCKMCKLECPAAVDIPKMMIEAKAAYASNNGLSLSDWALSRLDVFSPLGGLTAPLTNWALANRGCRWLLERTLGIARERKLPRFAARSFLRIAHRRHLTRPTRRAGNKVLYFVDTYANSHDPQLAEALVHVLEHNGVAVYVHPDQTQSGMAMVSLGALDAARRVAAHNVALLAEAVRQGYTILASEPSAALCLKQEYPALLDDEDVRLVADNTSEACSYLWNLHLTGRLQLDFKPLNAAVGYHMPCHLKALAVGSPGESLLRLIPGLAVHRIERGCSGMAGMYGLKQRNYRNSLRAGWGLISTMRASAWQAGTTECSACKMQMEQGTSKPTIHPIKLMALAYGGVPALRGLLVTRGQDLIVT